MLIIAFAYFYTNITFNPLEIANNMKRSGGFIPVSYTHLDVYKRQADITAFKATTVPVGEDQLPMIEQTREIEIGRAHV